MQQDSENAINRDQMTVGDIRDLVHQRLDEADDFDVDTVEISVDGGRIAVDGRVGTEGERQHVEQVIAALGARAYDNRVVVDELTRAQRADAADTARVEDVQALADLGESGKSTTDTAEHLLPRDGAESGGTQDVKEAIQEGKPYSPPDGPVQQGHQGGERH